MKPLDDYQFLILTYEAGSGSPRGHGQKAERVEYPGAVYHVLNRGNRREAIFRDDTDRQRFLDTLAEACAKTGWQIHALCLMPNHFHLVVETPQPNLVTGMKWFPGRLHRGLNRRHRRCGVYFSAGATGLVVDRCEMPVPTEVVWGNGAVPGGIAGADGGAHGRPNATEERRETMQG
ncbi:MAG: transposase [Verrucomicrobiales bacterium]|nr:transposase [Verrucomicrobiales bacterium]